MSQETNCPNCGAPSKSAPRAGTILCTYCKHSYRVGGPPPAAGGGGHAGPSESPLAAKGRDPLGGLVIKGIWESIRTGHQLVYLSGQNRILDFDSDGRFNVWNYDRTRSQGDPLPNGHASGHWSSIGSSHELISMGSNQVLDWEPDSGSFRVWFYDANARGSADIFPSVVTKGQWSSIQSSKRLVYLGGDRLLDWEPDSGHFRIWNYDRTPNGGDPLPTMAAEGEWGSIRTGHELVYLGHDLVLDWVPDAGNFRLWHYDRGARGRADVFPRELAAGNWASIRSGHQLISLEGDRVLDWEPESGAYRIWAVQR